MLGYKGQIGRKPARGRLILRPRPERCQQLFRGVSLNHVEAVAKCQKMGQMGGIVAFLFFLAKGLLWLRRHRRGVVGH